MRSIGKHFLILSFSITAFFALIIALSLKLYPILPRMDTEHSSETARKFSKTLFIGEPSEVVLGRYPLKSDLDNVILFGSSNVREGLRPDLINNILPGYNVHNMAVGASNITQIVEIVELADEYTPPKMSEGKRRDIIVLGVWYGSFLNNEERWKGEPTDVTNEKLRFGLYKKASSGKIVPAIPSEYFDTTLLLLRPYLLISKFRSQISAIGRSFIGNLLSIKSLIRTQDLDRDSVAAIDEKGKAKAMQFWYQTMGGHKGLDFKNEQFEYLMELAAKLQQQERILVIVDLPIARWHAQQSQHFKDYQKRKEPYIDSLIKSKRAHYINLQDLDDESTFYDSAHPRPSKAVEWSERLGANLLRILKEKKQLLVQNSETTKSGQKGK
jgi:hypothetical protein